MDSSDKDRQSRRRFFSTLLTAGLSLPSQWARAKADAIEGVPDVAKRKTAVSPPGSVSHAHLHSLCTACGLCIQKCPSKVLAPATSEYGAEGIMQPFLDFSKGWCDPDCTVCGEVCPTGAIKLLSSEEREDVRAGEAVVVRSLCVNAAEGVCDSCEEACPNGAIKMKEDYNAPVVAEDGSRRFRKYPEIESILCNGCGACEHTCPSPKARAIHVEGFETQL